MNRLLGIIVIGGLLILGGYKIISARVDYKNPKAVATAFLKALKNEDVSRAKKYYLPEKADEWETSATKLFFDMRSNATAQFKDSIPDEPTLDSAPSPKGSTDTTYKAGGLLIGMREVDGNWYVSQSPY